MLQHPRPNLLDRKKKRVEKNFFAGHIPWLKNAVLLVVAKMLQMDYKVDISQWKDKLLSVGTNR